jgi:putative transposase
MPRKARVVLPGELYHVTQRGNYRQKVFFDDQDRAVYLKYLEEYAQKYELKIYAFCLMDNHVHFIVSPCHNQSMAFAFRVTHQKYSLYLNKRLKQFGHRWQSRFYSCLLLGDHIQKAMRYVERNPVRAGMVNNPWQYAWSSARAHVGIRNKLLTLGDIKDYIEISYWKNYITQYDQDEDLYNIRIGTIQGKAIGPREMIEAIEKESGNKLTIRSRGRPFKEI